MIPKKEPKGIAFQGLLGGNNNPMFNKKKVIKVKIINSFQTITILKKSPGQALSWTRKEANLQRFSKMKAEKGQSKE